MNEIITLNEIQNLIYQVRGQKVMLDSDLAKLYCVKTFNLNKAVQRNLKRFPKEFMFQLGKEEWENLKFHNGISSSRHGGRRTSPYVFTEQGVAMLSSILNSEIAIQINIQIMKTFVYMRQYAIEHKDLAQRINELEKYFIQYAKDNNSEIDKINVELENVYKALDVLMDRTKPKQIGF